MAMVMKITVDRNSSMCMAGLLSDLCKLLLAVLASFSVDLATWPDELAVVAEVASAAPTGDVVEVVLMLFAAGAHLVISLSRAVEYLR